MTAIGVRPEDCQAIISGNVAVAAVTPGASIAAAVPTATLTVPTATLPAPTRVAVIVPTPRPPTPTATAVPVLGVFGCGILAAAGGERVAPEDVVAEFTAGQTE